MRTPDVDNARSWVVLIYCSIIYIVIAGSVKAFGVLYAEFLDYYESGAGNTAWVSSVCFLLLFGLGPISNFLGEHYTYRLIMCVGSCLILIGYSTSMFVPRLEFLYLTYGVITGIGCGLVFAPCTTIISFYFEKRRSLANGIMVAFSGFGSLGFPYMYRYLIDIYGLKGALLILGAIFFHVCPACMLLRQPVQIIQRRKQQREAMALNNSDHTKPKQTFLQEAKKRMFKIDLFKNPAFTVIFISIILQTGNFASNMVTLPGQVRSLGLGKQSIVLAMSLVGAAEIVARSFLGWFADLNVVSKKHLFMTCSFVSTVISFSIPHLPYRGALLAYAALLGGFSGSFWSLMGVLMADCVGLANLSPAIGLLSLSCGVAVFIVQPCAGWLEDATGSWDMSFRFAGTLSAISFILCLLEPWITKCWCCDEDEEKAVTINMEPVLEAVPETRSLLED